MKYKDIPRYHHCPFCQVKLKINSVSPQFVDTHLSYLTGAKIRTFCPNNQCKDAFACFYSPGTGSLDYCHILCRELKMLLEIFYPVNITRLKKMRYDNDGLFITFTEKVVEINESMKINCNEKSEIIRKNQNPDSLFMKYKNIPQYHQCPFCLTSLKKESISQDVSAYILGTSFDKPKFRTFCARNCGNIFVVLYSPGNGDKEYLYVFVKELEISLEIFYKKNISTLTKLIGKEFFDVKLGPTTFYTSDYTIATINDIPKIDFTDKLNIIKKIKTLVTFS